MSLSEHQMRFVEAVKTALEQVLSGKVAGAEFSCWLGGDYDRLFQGTFHRFGETPPAMQELPARDVLLSVGHGVMTWSTVPKLEVVAKAAGCEMGRE